MTNTEKLKQIMAKNLKKQLDRNGKTQTDLAKDLNIPETTVSNWTKGKTYPRIDKVQLMADYFKVTRSDLTEEKSEETPNRGIRVVSNRGFKKTNTGVSEVREDPIGYNGSYVADEPREEYRTWEFNSNSDDYFILDVDTDSMVPSIPIGSEVLVREQKEVGDGQIAAVMIYGGNLTALFRVKHHGSVSLLIPENPRHQPIVLSDDADAHIIGRAVEVKIKL